jgi:hypothetical protein
MSRGGRRARHNKSAAREIASTVAQVSYILAGPLLGLVAIRRYPFLVMDNTIYVVGLSSIAVLFILSFAVIRNSSLPRDLTVPQNVAFRAGVALCTTCLFLGIAGIIDGYAMPLTTRDVPAVAKHETLQRNRANRVHYVSVRAWPGSPNVVDLDAPMDVYDQLDLPLTAIDTPQAKLQAMPDLATVRLTVGEGRLGLPWLQAVGLPNPAPSP